MNRAATLGPAFGYHISMTDYFTLDTTEYHLVQFLICQTMMPVGSHDVLDVKAISDLCLNAPRNLSSVPSQRYRPASLNLTCVVAAVHGLDGNSQAQSSGRARHQMS